MEGALGRTRARATSTRSRAACRSTRACSRCSRRMDNGKSIRETRDIDMPLVARHFYHHAGWAQLLESEFAGYEAIGVVGQIIPWNFPLLMLAWKIAPALAARQHGGAQAGRVHAAHRAGASPRSRTRRACRRAWSTSSPATATRARRSSTIPDVDKIAFTGSTEVGRIIRKATAGSGKKLSARAGRQEPVHRLRRRRSRQRGRGRGRRDLVQPGPGVLRRLAPAGAGRHRRAARRQAARAHGEAAPRLAARQGRGHGRDRGAGAAGAHPRAGAAGRRRGRDDVAAVVGVSHGGLLLSAHAVHRRAALLDDRAGRDLRPGAGGDDVPHARGVGRAGEQHALRPRGERVDREHQPRARHRAEDQGRRRVDQLHQPVRRGRRLRRLSRERLRPRGRARGDVGVREASASAGGEAGRRERRRGSATSSRAAAPRHSARDPIAPRHRPHAQALHRRQAGASRRRVHASHRRARAAQLVGEAPDGNRKDIRNAVEAAHAARSGWGRATGHNRAQILYYIAENLAARARRIRGAHRRDDRVRCQAPRARRSTRRSSGCSPTPRGPTSTTARCTACRSAAWRSR